MINITYIDRHGDTAVASYTLIKGVFNIAIVYGFTDKAANFFRSRTGCTADNATHVILAIQNIQMNGAWRKYLPKEHLLNGMNILENKYEMEEDEFKESKEEEPKELFMYG